MFYTIEGWEIAALEVLKEVMNERRRQVAQYGHNEDLEIGIASDSPWLPVGVHGDLRADEVEAIFRADYEHYEMLFGKPTWMHLIREELAESFAEDDPKRLATELIQVAALCVSLVEKLQRSPE